MYGLVSLNEGINIERLRLPSLALVPSPEITTKICVLVTRPVAAKPSDLELTQDSVMTEVGGDNSLDQTNGNKTATPNGQDIESDTVQQPVKARFFSVRFCPLSDSVHARHLTTQGKFWEKALKQLSFCPPP